MEPGEPRYRGVFLCGDGETFVINATSGADDDLPTPVHARFHIADISRIARLDDPASLVDSNNAATMISARAIIERNSQET